MKPNYHVPRRIHYLILRMIGVNMRANIGLLHGIKGYYSDTYCDAWDLSVDDCELLPDQVQRDANAKLEHIALSPLTKICLRNFRLFERYAETAYPDKLVLATKLDTAGYRYYADAGHDNWASVKQMNKLLFDFLSDAGNAADLEAGMNMPATFIGVVTSGKTNFSDKYSEFKTSESGEGVVQQSKVQTENDLQLKGMGILKDGFEAANGDHALEELFTYEELKHLADAGGGAGAKGNLYTGVAHDPIDGATITIVEAGAHCESDSHGKFRSPAIATLPTKKFTIKITHPLYNDVTLLEQEINPHTYITRHIEMFLKPPPPPPPLV